MPDEEHHTSAMVTAVRDMVVKLEQHTRNGDEARQKLLESVDERMAALRQDVHKTLMALQLTQSDHSKVHTADLVERSNRQTVVDSQLNQIRNWVAGALIGTILIVGILLGWLVF